MKPYEGRRLKIQKWDLKNPIAPLEQRIKRISPIKTPKAQELLRAWRAELHMRRELLCRLASGETVTQTEIDNVSGAGRRNGRERAAL